MKKCKENNKGLKTQFLLSESLFNDPAHLEDYITTTIMLCVILPNLWHLLKENWTEALCCFTDTFCPCSPPSEGLFIKNRLASTDHTGFVTYTAANGVLLLFVRTCSYLTHRDLRQLQILRCVLNKSWLSQIYLLQFHLWHEPCCVINLTTLINHKHGDMHVVEGPVHNLFPHIAAQAMGLGSSKHARNKNNHIRGSHQDFSLCLHNPRGLFCG